MIEIHKPTTRSHDEKRLYTVLARLLQYVGLFANDITPIRLRLFYIQELNTDVVLQVGIVSTALYIHFTPSPKFVIINEGKVYFDSSLPEFSTLNEDVDKAIGDDMMALFILARRVMIDPLI